MRWISRRERKMENKIDNCSLCLSGVNSEEADILTMGGYGTPKYLCPECAKKIDNVLSGRDYDSIVLSLDELNASVIKNNIDNGAVLATITKILSDGAERANKIKEGTLDFDKELEEETEEEFEITEELMESEEDKLLDEKEAVVQKKLDKITSVLSGIILVAAIAYLIWYFFIS